MHTKNLFHIHSGYRSFCAKQCKQYRSHKHAHQLNSSMCAQLAMQFGVKMSILASSLLGLFLFQEFQVLRYEFDQCFTLTDFLSILSMVMFPYIRPEPFFWDFDIKMHGNDNKWYLNQFRWFWSLFSINRKQSQGGALVGKFKKIS